MSDEDKTEDPEIEVVEEVKVEEKKVIEYRKFEESMSPTIGELAGAMAKAQGQMTNGSKDKQGYGYKYMTLSNLTEIAREPLSKAGLAVIQSHELVRGEVPTVVTHTTIMHNSGEWHKSSIELPITIMSNLSLPQMVGVVATYGRRYALQAVCLIAAEEDNDASKQG